MEKPTLIENNIRAELDETCEKIVNIFLVNHIYESDKVRYNQAFDKTKKILKISKPTFNDHIKHLIKKKMIARKETGKQKVFLYLDADNPKILNAKEMIEQLTRETNELMAIMKRDPNFWKNIPIFLSEYFAICELRRNLAIFKTVFDPECSNDSILALALQAKWQASIQDEFMNRIFLALNQAASGKEKGEMQAHIVESLKGAINETFGRITKTLEHVTTRTPTK